MPKPINLNDLAFDIVSKEGLKKQISIAQVKEVLKIVFTELSLEEVCKVWFKYNK
jgi:hypothetical protein